MIEIIPKFNGKYNRDPPPSLSGGVVVIFTFELREYHNYSPEHFPSVVLASVCFCLSRQIISFLYTGIIPGMKVALLSR